MSLSLANAPPPTPPRDHSVWLAAGLAALCFGGALINAAKGGSRAGGRTEGARISVRGTLVEAREAPKEASPQAPEGASAGEDDSLDALAQAMVAEMTRTEPPPPSLCLIASDVLVKGQGARAASRYSEVARGVLVESIAIAPDDGAPMPIRVANPDQLVFRPAELRDVKDRSHEFNRAFQGRSLGSRYRAQCAAPGERVTIHGCKSHDDDGVEQLGPCAGEQLTVELSDVVARRRRALTVAFTGLGLVAAMSAALRSASLPAFVFRLGDDRAVALPRSVWKAIVALACLYGALAIYAIGGAFARGLATALWHAATLGAVWVAATAALRLRRIAAVARRLRAAAPLAGPEGDRLVEVRVAPGQVVDLAALSPKNKGRPGRRQPPAFVEIEEYEWNVDARKFGKRLSRHVEPDPLRVEDPTGEASLDASAATFDLRGLPLHAPDAIHPQPSALERFQFAMPGDRLVVYGHVRPVASAASQQLGDHARGYRDAPELKPCFELGPRGLPPGGLFVSQGTVASHLLELGRARGFALAGLAACAVIIAALCWTAWSGMFR